MADLRYIESLNRMSDNFAKRSEEVRTGSMSTEIISASLLITAELIKKEVNTLMEEINK